MESLGGRTLLPGFIDTHVHFGFADGRALATNNSDVSRSLHALESAERMRVTLEADVTGARDLGGADAGFRVARERGLIRGPRLSMALRLMSHTGGHADEGIDLMLEHGTFLVPTLTTFDFEDRIHLMSQKAIDTKRALAEDALLSDRENVVLVVQGGEVVKGTRP